MKTQLYNRITINFTKIFFLVLFFLISIAYFNISCDNLNNKNEESDKALAKKNAITSINEHYDTLTNKFDKKLICHFPISLDTNVKAISSSTASSANIFLLFTATKNDNIDSVYQHFNTLSLKKYSPGDSCLLVANRFENDSNFWKLNKKDVKTKEINKQCYEDKLPVPNFYRLDSYSTNKNECRLHSDFRIFVLDANLGKYKDINVLPDAWYMPKEWKHGYSRGVAISKKRKVIIYWVILW